MLVAKHMSMLDTQQASGCLREKAVEPANIIKTVHMQFKQHTKKVTQYDTSHSSQWETV